MRRELLQKKRLLKAYINDLKKIDNFETYELIKELKELYEYYKKILEVI